EDRPDVDDRVALGYEVDVVEVHGRRAISREQLEAVANAKRRARGELETRVLLVDEVFAVFNADPCEPVNDLGWHAVDPDRLAADVHDGEVTCARGDRA